jgi:hypothetical protein
MRSWPGRNEISRIVGHVVIVPTTPSDQDESLGACRTDSEADDFSTAIGLWRPRTDRGVTEAQ